eukprot:6209868-Pleurochrysis_carterae.AAC.1
MFKTRTAAFRLAYPNQTKKSATTRQISAINSGPAVKVAGVMSDFRALGDTQPKQSSAMACLQVRGSADITANVTFRLVSGG